MDVIEQEFTEVVMQAVRDGEEIGYGATVFLDMCNKYGVVETCRRLMNGKQMPYGVLRLKQLHRLDLTIEAIVYDNPKFRPLFPAKTLQDAFARLSKLGYV